GEHVADTVKMRRDALGQRDLAAPAAQPTSAWPAIASDVLARWHRVSGIQHLAGAFTLAITCGVVAVMVAHHHTHDVARRRLKALVVEIITVSSGGKGEACCGCRRRDQRQPRDATGPLRHVGVLPLTVRP